MIRNVPAYALQFKNIRMVSNLCVTQYNHLIDEALENILLRPIALVAISNRFEGEARLRIER
jgi:hypothetical protein